MKPLATLALLCALIVVYVCIGVIFKILLLTGVVNQSVPPSFEQLSNDSWPDPTHRLSERILAAATFFEKNLVEENGHVDLYWMANPNTSFPQMDNTNSEALSYYLLWTVRAGKKSEFDKALSFIETRMLHPRWNYLQWRLEENGSVIGDGSNIASDADLRTIHALMIAEQRWKEPRYSQFIDTLAKGLEQVAITQDGMLAPYGGDAGNNRTWTANEVWLSYSDFIVFQELAQRRGEPWHTVYKKMKDATLLSQIYNGLYNSQLTERREYGNGIDGGKYSINSLWIMVRNAESGDPDLRESAKHSLEFYKSQYKKHGKLYESYLSDGTSTEQRESAWVYALVARAALLLQDWQFSDALEERLLAHQQFNSTSPLYGAFPEGDHQRPRVGQFTMQESILTLQEYLRNSYAYELYRSTNLTVR